MRIALAVLLVLVTSIAGAQSSAPPKDQWEYLVVAKDGVPFNPIGWHSSESIRSEAEANKLYRYGEGKLPLQESTDTEAALDTLGSAGWELVTIVGVIGGDQQFVFKRKVSATVNATEKKTAKATLDAVVKKNDKDIALYRKEEEKRLAEEAEAAEKERLEQEAEAEKQRLQEMAEAEAEEKQEKERALAEQNYWIDQDKFMDEARAMRPTSQGEWKKFLVLVVKAAGIGDSLVSVDEDLYALVTIDPGVHFSHDEARARMTFKLKELKGCYPYDRSKSAFISINYFGQQTAIPYGTLAQD
jgi:hypothetical protein